MHRFQEVALLVSQSKAKNAYGGDNPHSHKSHEYRCSHRKINANSLECENCGSGYFRAPKTSRQKGEDAKKACCDMSNRGGPESNNLNIHTPQEQPEADTFHAPSHGSDERRLQQ